MSANIHNDKKQYKNKIKPPPYQDELQQQSSFPQIDFYENHQYNNNIIDKLQDIETLSSKILKQINEKLYEKIDKLIYILAGQLQSKIEKSYYQFNDKLINIQRNQELMLSLIQQPLLNQLNPQYNNQIEPQHNNHIEESQFHYSIDHDMQDQDVYQSMLNFEMNSSSRFRQINQQSHTKKQQSQQQNKNGLKNMQYLKILNDRFQEMQLQFDDFEVLYQYPEMKQINFHQKIDSLSNILFVAELKDNKNVIGAFTSNPFKSKGNFIPKANPKSFLFNITLNRHVYAHRTNKTHTYDPNYLIFGNWEIKIKSGGNILQTTWGSNADSFSKRSYNIEGDLVRQCRQWLFGNGTNQLKQIQIQKYCIFQLKQHDSSLM